MKSVATAVDQAAGGSKLKEAACFLECVAKVAEKDAALTLAFVQKVSISLSSSFSIAALIKDAFFSFGETEKDLIVIW